MSLVCHDLTVRFGATAALSRFSVAAAPRRTTAVIGPSGCGKSTLLRVVAGLQPLDEGTVEWDGADVAGLAPHERPFGLMFQDYALFPHRTVAENVEFGLRMAGKDPRDRRRRVGELLELVGLAGYGNRSIATLSGGEQQRTALARTLAPEPALLMLDEPIGSLDQDLRQRLLRDMRRIFEALETTVLYVTHDQQEAFAIAGDVIVMRRGSLVAHGSPHELWDNPGSSFTARFIGHENVLGPHDAAALLGDRAPGGSIVIPPDAVSLEASTDGQARVVAASLRAGVPHTEVEVLGQRLVATGGTRLDVGVCVDATIDVKRLVVLADDL